MILMKKSKNDKFVRIIIGTAVHGEKGLIKPTKTISVTDTNVEEVTRKILEMIQDQKREK